MWSTSLVVGPGALKCGGKVGSLKGWEGQQLPVSACRWSVERTAPRVGVNKAEAETALPQGERGDGEEAVC